MGRLFPMPFTPSAELTALSRSIDGFFDDFTAFAEKIQFIGAIPNNSPWHEAVVGLTWRSIENLESIRLLTMAGRPVAAYIVFRSLYESWLYILLLGFHQGGIDPNFLHGSAQGPFTREDLAIRFLDFSAHARLYTLEYWKESPSWQQELQANPLILDRSSEGIQASSLSIESEGQAARAKYGWQRFTTTWLPFKSLRDLKNHLWPEGGQKRFPDALVPVQRKVWQDAFFMSYNRASHDVHNSAHSLKQRYSQNPAIAGRIQNTPFEDSSCLDLAYNIEIFLSGAFADACGVLPQWNESMESLFKKDHDLEEAIRQIIKETGITTETKPEEERSGRGTRGRAVRSR